MSSAEGNKSYERFCGEKYPRVDKDEITRVNRDLVTGAASIFDAIDLQKKAERAGQVLRRVTYYPQGGQFARIQLETVTASSLRYKLSDDMQTVVSVETPIDPELNIIIKPVADAKSPLGQALLGTTHPVASTK